jgi:hypothetical protein
MIGAAVNLQDVTSDILPDADNTRNLGSAVKRFASMYAVEYFGEARARKLSKKRRREIAVMGGNARQARP